MVHSVEPPKQIFFFFVCVLLVGGGVGLKQHFGLDSSNTSTLQTIASAL